MSESKKELIEEHTRLTNILHHGSPKQRKEEYHKQKKELDELKEGKPYSPVNKDEDGKPLVVRGIFNNDGMRITHAFQSKDNGWVHSGHYGAEPRPLKHVLKDVKEDGHVEALDVMHDGGKESHKKELDKIKQVLSHIKEGKNNITKSNYGPKGAGLYDSNVNIKRKENRTGEMMEDAGQNKAVHEYTSATQGTAKEQANTLSTKDAKKNKKQPVKTFKDLSPEEQKVIIEQYQTKIDDKLTKASKKLALLRSALQKAIEESKCNRLSIININNISDEQIANQKIIDKEEY